jgi:transcriptional regulator with XRE-family HTH domain
VAERKTIRQLRQARGWTQQQLAARVALHHTTISQWERGVRRPEWRYTQRLAALFGVPVEAIAFGPGEQAPG